MDEDSPESFFHPAQVERVGNVILIHCENEDDAVIAFELFREVALGKTVSFRKAD